MTEKTKEFYPELSANYNFPELEEKILDYWKERKVFQESVDTKKAKKKFYFYDGPPFATGLPHYGHLIGGSIKDIVPRYWTMRGFQVERRFGWDCHGLPVEFEMEKTLKLNGSLAIQDYGVAKFNEACRSIVLRYTGEWKKTVERMGRWVDMENDYKTMQPEFMESVWWVFKRLWDKGLVYQGKKVVPYSWRLTAPLSNFEASQNYQSVQDPSVAVLLKLKDAPEKWGKAALSIWTTTPWTLPSNLAVSIQKDPKKLQYSLWKLEGNPEVDAVVCADFAAESYGFSEKIQSIANDELLGLHYEALFQVLEESVQKNEDCFRVIDGSDFVVEGSGTGLVHTAPAHGEVDFYAAQKAGINALDLTTMEGKFSAQAAKDPALAKVVGVFVKDADKEIIQALKDKNLLLKQDTIQHSYPFCERSDTPLINKAISSWFVKVDDIKDQMIANNKKIRWVPGHIQEGRFGKWLENARDWCISRNRFWGTPIPVWICSACDAKKVISSREELSKLAGKEVPDIHKHFVDEIHFDCEECSEKNSMNRTPEVLDCWFESGSMPYAQEHYPFENKEKLEATFPANFIAEGIDQTRGWFYTLTVLSTALFNKPAFENCVVNGIVLAEDGRKMSKRLKNYPDPKVVFDKYGADALRLYLAQSPAMYGESFRFSEKNIVELLRAVMIPMWNSYSFFASYSNIDSWSHTNETSLASPKFSLLDRWITARATQMEKEIHEKMEKFHVFEIAPILISFIDDLTNWYIRLNRKRYWSKCDEASREDKNAAYLTLYRSLERLSFCIAPMMPFIAETFSAALKGLKVDELIQEKAYSSIHLAEYHDPQELQLNTESQNLLKQVDYAKKIILLGRSLRGEAKIGLRQPLLKLRVAGVQKDDQKLLLELKDLILREVNVKDLELVEKAHEIVNESAKPNFKTLGKKLGKNIKELQKVLSTWTSSDVTDFEKNGSFEFSGHTLNKEDIEVVRRAKEGKLALADFGLVAELDASLTPELIREGLEREIVNRVQQRRKEAQFNLSDRIEINYWATPGSLIEELLDAEMKAPGYIAQETLTTTFHKSTEALENKESISENGEISFSLSR